MQPSIFKPMSQEEIEEMVFDNLKKQAQNRNLQLANRDNIIGEVALVSESHCAWHQAGFMSDLCYF
jgi:hypothetical protein